MLNSGETIITMVSILLCFTRTLKRHAVFQYGGDMLKKIINKDVVIPEIQESLLSTEHLGQAQMKESLRGQTSV